jgi:LmbE family N-acetylglucosaminyl deacetylase
MNREVVLIIAPHADDEVLGCGGYISKNQYTKDIHVIVVAHREEYRLENLKNISNIESRYRIKYHLLNNIDERLDIMSSSDLTKQIERLYLKIKPTIVFIPFCNDINSDHTAVHKSCLISFRKIQNVQPKELLMYEIPSSTTQGSSPFFPNTYFILTKEDVEMKWELLSLYKSETREYPNPRSRVGLETYARFRGMECNREFAEAYISLYKINEETS